MMAKYECGPPVVPDVDLNEADDPMGAERKSSDPDAAAVAHRELNALLLDRLQPDARLQVLLRQWRDRYGDAALNAELDARRDAELDERRDAELDERRELLAWEEERATNDAYEKLARGWIG